MGIFQNCTENEIFNAIFNNNFYDILDNKDTIIGQFKNIRFVSMIIL